MKNIQSGSRSVTSVWHFSASRSGLVPILIFDCVTVFFYYAWEFTDGREGIPPEYTIALLIVVHGVQLFVFLLEVAVRTCQWVTSLFTKQDKKAIRLLLRRSNTQALLLCVLLGLCVLVASSYIRASDPYIEGSVPIQNGIAKYKLYHHDQSAHYYIERKDSRDGIVVTILCKEGTNHLMEKTYVRCLYQKPGTVMGRPPMRAPGSWVTSSLTEQEKEVLVALKERGVLK